MLSQQTAVLSCKGVAMPATPPDPARWSTLEAELHAWRQSHPAATFTELEAAVDARVNALRAALLGELAPDLPADAERCPHCGTRLVRRGTHPRTLITHGDQAVTLRRSYQTCPACGAGLFPPR